MKFLINALIRLGVLKDHIDYHLLRASMVIIFFFFGYQKWFEYEAQALIPYISNGPLIFWMYPVFGTRGATYFLGVTEWLFGALIFLGFWNKRLGILGALGSCFSFVATVTIIPFMPDGWAASAGELAAGRDAAPYLNALENFAVGIGLIPEQIWDAPDLPSRHFVFGGETGSAVPLLWAHAEYIKLCRSAADGKNCDLVEPAYDRYVRNPQERRAIEVWKINRQIPKVTAGTRLRIQAGSPFVLHWTVDEWQHYSDSRSTSTNLDIEFVDVPVPEKASIIRFTFLWLNENRWEGSDYQIDVHRLEAPDAIGSDRPRENGRVYGAA